MKYKKYIGIFVLIIAALFILPDLCDTLLEEKANKIVKQKSHQIIKDFLRGLSADDNIPLEKLSNLNFIDSSVIQAGKLEMQKHRAVVTGIARDNVVDLPIMMRHIEYLGEFFADYRVIIFENDSVDGTKEVLLAWSKRNPKVQVISESFANKKRPSIGFLADIRNKYLDAMKNASYDNFDIMIPVDMDMSYGFDIRGVFDSFSEFAQWGAVCANGIFTKEGKMYDMFAFRNDEFPYGINDVSSVQYWSSIVPKGQKIYDPKSDLVLVSSCFGGLAIYKREFVKDCKYSSDRGDCEHVLFNKCVRDNGAKMFMNPAQVIRYSHYR
jgi:hypothetical protein